MANMEEKFICEICYGDDKADWGTLSNLIKHQTMVHRDKIEETCVYCSFRCMHYQDLIIHHKEKHRDKIPNLLKSNQNHKFYSGQRKRKKVQTGNVVEPEDGELCTAFNGACKYVR